MLEYQNQHSRQTLKQALEEYREVNKEILSYDNQRESEFFFIPHDVCHVIFGCDTNLEDEAITDAWTIFGTNISMKQFREFTKLESHQEIMQKIGTWGAINTFIKSIPRIVKVIFSSLRLKKKWKWEEYNLYMDDELSELRAEFNIKLV